MEQAEDEQKRTIFVRSSEDILKDVAIDLHSADKLNERLSSFRGQGELAWLF